MRQRKKSQFLLNVIKELLTQFPELRDDDKKLFWRVWEKEKHVFVEHMSYGSYLSPTRTKEGTIRKYREQIQQENFTLRASEAVQAQRNKRKKHKTSSREFVQYRYEGNVAIPIVAGEDGH